LCEREEEGSAVLRGYGETRNCGGQGALRAKTPEDGERKCAACKAWVDFPWGSSENCCR